MPKKNSLQLPPVTEAGQQKQRTRREEMAELLAQRQREERRRGILTQVGAAAVVILVVLGVTVAVLATRGDDAAGTTPPGLTADGTIRFGSDDAAVTVRAVEDFQCPACRQFEATLGDTLADYRASDDVAVEYQPIAFLDRASSTEYSSRALNASMCVLADAGADAWMTMHEALYAQQPPEGGAGLDDDTLTQMAADAGAEDGDVADCISDRRYDDWVESQTTEVMTDIDSTPTVFVDGEQVEPADLVSAVDAARS